ncbi:MAG TPA: hypothetical protein VN253_10515 [Kofleriaceae bacterium]|nr:hypothetical protein [Kofleriaceae bacterium]
MRIAIAVALALAACKGGKKDEAKGQPGAGSGSETGPGAGPVSATSSAQAAAAPDPMAALSVRFAGKPIPMQRAFVKRMDPDRYQVYITNGGGSCQELLDNMFGAGDRIAVLASVTPRLNADGKTSFQITDVYEGAPTMVIEPGARAAFNGAAAKGEAVEVVLDFVARAKESEAKQLLVEVHGSFTAEGCGTRNRDPAGVPRAAHPTAATVTIANRRLELKGAIVKRAGREPDLLLSTGSKDCSSTTPWASVILERTGGRWRASGTWLEHEASAAQRPDEQGFKAVLGAAGTSDDGPTVQLALSGAGKLGGYAIALDGTIEALDCKK